MAIVEEAVSLTRDTVSQMQQELGARGLDGWLLYNFHGLNPVASAVLGLPAMTRRYAVLVPASGAPIALTHRIEQQPWRGWIGENRVYLSWREFEAGLAAMLAGRRRVALEYTADDAVPYVDRVPAGVVELVRGAGAEPVSSGDLISAFYARWGAEGEASHRRAAAVVQRAAHGGFALIAERLKAGGEIGEWEVREWIQAELARGGLKVGADSIVAIGVNAANPHYGPSAREHAPIREGDPILIDLWGKESETAIYADQSWMGYAGAVVPDRLRELWSAVRDARDAAIALIRDRTAAGEPIAGYEADDAARAVISERGWGDAFIHRTGHSIDRELHGSGPNIDNLETRDTRTLIRGVGFSIEPGIYLAGDIGLRTEVDVFMGADGPEVTTPEPQREVFALLA